MTIKKQHESFHNSLSHTVWGWQPGSSLSRDIKFLYLAILFWAIPHSLCGPNQCPLFFLFSESDFRDMSGGWKRESWQKQRRQTCCRDSFLWALGKRKSLLSQVSERTEDCCHGHLVTTALLGFGDHINRTANTASTVGHWGLLWQPGYFSNHSHRDAPVTPSALTRLTE